MCVKINSINNTSLVQKHHFILTYNIMLMKKKQIKQTLF